MIIFDIQRFEDIVNTESRVTVTGTEGNDNQQRQ